MTCMVLRRMYAVAIVIGAVTMVTGCGLLDVSNPTKIEEGELVDGASADLLRRAALQRFKEAFGYGVRSSALFSDEAFTEPDPWNVSAGYVAPEEIWDRRKSEQEVKNGDNTFGTPYDAWQRTRAAVAIALPKIEAYMTGSARSAYMGQMLAVRGYATMRLAEDFCPGFPLHQVEDYKLEISDPVTTEEALERALADFDSAVTLAADSAAILDFARVGQARTLLALGRFAEAGAAAAPVPTTFHFDAEYTTSGTWVVNPVAISYYYQGGGVSLVMAEREGGNGLPFVSAEDPRTPSDVLGTANDGVTPINSIGKYPTNTTPMVIASGTEARLIEAEAALRAGQSQWITILNGLRTAPGGPGLSDTTAPASPDAQVDLLFRERAFWLYLTGHRLGDLNRLVRFYNRMPAATYPNGAYRLGGTYDAGIALPFPVAAEAKYNPAITGCLSS